MLQASAFDLHASTSINQELLYYIGRHIEWYIWQLPFVDDIKSTRKPQGVGHACVQYNSISIVLHTGIRYSYPTHCSCLVRSCHVNDVNDCLPN